MLQENLMQAFCDSIANVFILRYINLFYKHYKLSKAIWLLDFFRFKRLKRKFSQLSWSEYSVRGSDFRAALPP